MSVTAGIQKYNYQQAPGCWHIQPDIHSENIFKLKLKHSNRLERKKEREQEREKEREKRGRDHGYG